jgi:hypothetical protein
VVDDVGHAVVRRHRRELGEAGQALFDHRVVHGRPERA